MKVKQKNQAKQTLWIKMKNLIRDPDVLDTWFSSGIWPFATLGWPDDKDFVE